MCFLFSSLLQESGFGDFFYRYVTQVAISNFLKQLLHRHIRQPVPYSLGFIVAALHCETQFSSSQLSPQ